MAGSIGSAGRDGAVILDQDRQEAAVGPSLTVTSAVTPVMFASICNCTEC